MKQFSYFIYIIILYIILLIYNNIYNESKNETKKLASAHPLTLASQLKKVISLEMLCFIAKQI